MHPAAQRSPVGCIAFPSVFHAQVKKPRRAPQGPMVRRWRPASFRAPLRRAQRKPYDEIFASLDIGRIRCPVRR